MRARFGRPMRSGQKADHRAPPDGVAWTWIPYDLLRSAPWRAQSLNCRRLIDLLKVDLCSHAGMNNGSLQATRKQMVECGIHPRHITATIHEGKSLGLIRCKHGKRCKDGWEANRFTLTWMGTRNQDATNDWKRVTL